MKSESFEGILVALLPQRGSALMEILREAARQVLGKRDLRAWAIEYGPLPSPSGAIAFRLSSLGEPFPWKEGAGAELARLVSRMGPGRCWALAVDKGSRSSPESFGEGYAFDRGEKVEHEECHGPDARAEALAWFGEQLALSENEILAAFESCDQVVGVLGGEERVEDEVDLLLERARREFEQYRALKEERERQRS